MSSSSSSSNNDLDQLVEQALDSRDAVLRGVPEALDTTQRGSHATLSDEPEVGAKGPYHVSIDRLHRILQSWIAAKPNWTKLRSQWSYHVTYDFDGCSWQSDCTLVEMDGTVTRNTVTLRLASGHLDYWRSETEPPVPTAVLNCYRLPPGSKGPRLWFPIEHKDTDEERCKVCDLVLTALQVFCNIFQIAPLASVEYASEAYMDSFSIETCHCDTLGTFATFISQGNNELRICFEPGLPLEPTAPIAPSLAARLARLLEEAKIKHSPWDDDKEFL